jgi:hypothetical protein
MKSKTGIPFVWHFKESPHEAMKIGLWDKLIDLYSYAEGKIFLNPEAKNFYEQFILTGTRQNLEYILDPELPKKNCFISDFSEKLSKKDGNIHTVVVGRMIGLSLEDIRLLAKNNIHIHLYNENYISEADKINPYKIIVPKHFHVHHHCSQFDWVKEFSKYDAGWLHCINSNNKGNIKQASWEDLNLPARINTLVAAGLPIIQKENTEHIVAMKNYIQNYDIGIFYTTIDDLVNKLRNKPEIARLNNNILIHRSKFTFDYHVPDLIDFFRKVISCFNQS